MKSVFLKTYIALVAVMFATLIATLVITDSLLEDVDTKVFETEAIAEYRLLTSAVKDQHSELESSFIESYLPTFEIEVTIKDLDMEPERHRSMLKGAAFGVFTGADQDIWTYLVLHPDGRRVIVFSETDNNFSDIPREDWLEFLIPVCALFLVMGLGILYLARKLIDPVNHLTEVAIRFGSGKFAVRADVNKTKPIAILASRFNQMAERIAGLVREQEVIIGAIPHELRTPLAKARFALDLTRDKEGSAALKKQIEQVDDSIDELENMVDTILELNRLHALGTVAIQPFNIADAVTRYVANIEGDTNLNFRIENEAEGNPELMVHSNEKLLGIAINNLLRNAVRHADSEVIIHLSKIEDGKIRVAIEDDGEGIPTENLSEIFTPFFRLDESRNRDSGGVGLGLTIVKLIAGKLELDVVAGKSKLGGALFYIEMDAQKTGDT